MLHENVHSTFSFRLISHISKLDIGVLQLIPIVSILFSSLTRHVSRSDYMMFHFIHGLPVDRNGSSQYLNYEDCLL